MFGINKNGTKHKIGIIMPAFFPASRVTYDGGTVEDVLGSNTFGEIVDITSYTTEANMYTFPSDGYLVARAYGSGTHIMAILYDANGTRPQVSGVSASGTTIGGTKYEARSSMFVRKGMKARRGADYAGMPDIGIYFIPLT